MGAARASDTVPGRRGGRYAQFLEDLYALGIALPAEEVKCEVGVFFVPRKDAKLRWIFDTRQANGFSEEPPLTELPSPESLGDLVLPIGAQLYLATGDVVVCFHQYALPRALRCFFVLPGLCRRYLSARMRARLPLDVDLRLQRECCLASGLWMGDGGSLQ